ncbi:MFS transporter [Vibrio profundum]|uniref:MFS transporter n=1 Tax=Vibrio profundum TaxID=2910247 RepID=UPI003D118D72
MRNRTLPYLTARFFDGISSGLFMMALPWIMLDGGSNGYFVAFTALTSTSLSFFATPFFATLIDRHSRKSLIVLNQILQTMVAGVTAGLYAAGFGSIWLLAATQVIFWLSANFAWATDTAFTQENYHVHEYAKLSSYQEIIMQGTTLGAGALGVVLLQLWGIFEFALFAAIASAIASSCYIATPYRRKMRTPSHTRFLTELKQSKQILAKQPRFFAYLALSCLSYPVLSYLSKLVPIWFSEQNITGSWFAGYNICFGVGSLVTGLLITKILAKLPFSLIIQNSILALAIALLGMSLFPFPAAILGFSAVFGLFNALNRITRINWMHHRIEITQRGRVDGGLAMFSTMIQSIGYTIIALLSHYDLVKYGFLVAAVTMGLAYLMMRTLTQQTDFPAQILTDC